MERILQATSDGSHTIAIPELQVTYHSKHGAIQESMHVFIDAGLRQTLTNVSERLQILEIGFGTGLNALLTLLEAPNRLIRYESLEAYPLQAELASSLNYGTLLPNTTATQLLGNFHRAPWEEPVSITPEFTLLKRQMQLQDFTSQERYHMVYFDAFAPTAQPELWTTQVFTNIYKHLLPRGILVTYCSKGIVRRAMQHAGFNVEKIPGPPGKREMVRAIKN